MTPEGNLPAVDAELQADFSTAALAKGCTVQQALHDVMRAYVQQQRIEAERAALWATYPKSYRTEAEWNEDRAEGLSENSIFASEAEAALMAGDGETSWAWLAKTELPAHSLAFLKGQYGSEFIRAKGFDTRNADAAYGPDWLDRP